MDLISKTKKNVQDFNDKEWSEIAQKFDAVPQQIYWKVKRLSKDHAVEQPVDAKASKKDMITRALMSLP